MVGCHFGISLDEGLSIVSDLKHEIRMAQKKIAAENRKNTLLNIKSLLLF
jgi:hypothetical protein